MGERVNENKDKNKGKNKSNNEDMEQISLFDLDICVGKTSPGYSPATTEKISVSSLKKSVKSTMTDCMFLDLSMGSGDLQGRSYWESYTVWHGAYWTLNTGASPKDAVECFLSQILEVCPHQKYYLSKTACLGILRRAEVRGKKLPEQLEHALKIQAGVLPVGEMSLYQQQNELKSYHINQRNEGIDLNQLSGALMATRNMQMQTFVKESYEVSVQQAQEDDQGNRSDSDSGTGTENTMADKKHCSTDLVCLSDQGGDFMNISNNLAPTLRAQMGGHLPVIADGQGCSSVHDKLPTATTSQQNQGSTEPPSHNQQPIVMATQQGGAEITQGICPTITASAGMSGNNQPVVYLNDGVNATPPKCASFCGCAGKDARGVGYQEDCAPTLKTGTAPTVVTWADASLNTHHPQNVDVVEAHESPQLFDNHPQDGRYDGPLDIAPTIMARFGTGGNNIPLLKDPVPRIASSTEVQAETQATPPIAYSLDSKDSNSMKSNNPHSGCRETSQARTLDTSNPNPSKNQGGIAIVQPRVDAQLQVQTLASNDSKMIEEDITNEPPAIENYDNPPQTDAPQSYCIAGNIINRATKNGGNGFGYQPELSYTITATDRHSVCPIQPYQNIVGALMHRDYKGIGRSYVQQDKCIVQPNFASMHSVESVVESENTSNIYDDAPISSVFGESSYGGYDDNVATLCASGGSIGGGSENLAVQ